MNINKTSLTRQSQRSNMFNCGFRFQFLSDENNMYEGKLVVNMLIVPGDCVSDCSIQFK